MPTDLSSSQSPFYAKDSSGRMQKIKVIDLPAIDPVDNQIAGYAYVEVTGSTYDTLQNLQNSLFDIKTDISNSILVVSNIDTNLSDISGNINIIKDALVPIADAIDHVTASVDRSTLFVEQLLRFNRATNVFSKCYTRDNLFETSSIPPVPLAITLHMDADLNPAANTTDSENYMSKAVEVIIQNSTNKNVYLTVSYNPSAPVTSGSYTVKIQPGVIYNSECQIAHMRHKISFDESDCGELYNTIVGNVAATITYNDSLNHNLSIGQTAFGAPYISSIATNYYEMPFVAGAKYVVAEWYFQTGSQIISSFGTGSFNGMTIRGQAKVAYPAPDIKQQALTIYLTKDGDNTPIAGRTAVITSETPTNFSLDYTDALANITTARYELIAEVTGSGDIGDARVLFADLIRRYTP